MSLETSGSRVTSPESGSDPSAGLRLVALPAVSERAFPLEHDYFEIVYTPLVGPTAVLLARAMLRHLKASGSPTLVSAVELALQVGIRASNTDPLGRRSHLVRAIDRLAHDHIAVHLRDRDLGIRVAAPPLSRRALGKVPALARDVHNHYCTWDAAGNH